MADFIARFWAKVDRQCVDACWEWLACRDRDGYGVLGPNETGQRKAHRVAYLLLVGPIPEGLVIDHLCRNRGCVNPAHLEPVTNAENIRRSPIAGTAVNARKTHCKRGHEFTPENTYVHPTRGYRLCRTCARAKASQTRVRTGPRIWIPKTECNHGHDLTDPANVRINREGHRSCRTCNRLRARENRAARKAAA